MQGFGKLGHDVAGWATLEQARRQAMVDSVLVPSCPPQSLTSVVALQALVASCGLKKGLARPRRRV